MARLHSVGFELAGSIAAAPTSFEINAVSANVSPLSIQSTTKRSGTYALRVGGSGQPLINATQHFVDIRFTETAGLGPFYARAYVRFETLPSGENRFIAVVGGSMVVYATVDNTGTVALYDSGGSIGTASTTLTTATWYRIELEMDGSGAAGSDTVGLYIDGTEEVRATNRDISSTVQWLRVGGNMGGESNTTGEWYFDDLAVNNSTGTAQTGLPGAGSIVHLWPDGDGDADTVVTRSSGSTTPTGTDRGANWQQLGNAFDKPSPNNGTDFLLLTGNTSKVLVSCESYATGGIGASDTITLVQVGARVAAAAASTANWIPRIMSQSAGTEVTGTTTTIASTTWATHDDTTNAGQYKLTQYVDPQAGGAWTTSLLDSMQIGASTTDGNPDTLITALWALVEYVENVGGGSDAVPQAWAQYRRRMA